MGENPGHWRGAASRFSVVSIVGTRPEAIKMAPVARALAESSMIRHAVLLTGQHEGLGAAFNAYPHHELDLPLAQLDFEGQRDRLRKAITGYLADALPDLVLVQGDTTSALAGALAAHDCGIAVAHVEAGLRSHDREPWPEEDNRIQIDTLSSLLFAPTETAAANLAADQRIWGAVHVTGNTGIDALLSTKTSPPDPVPSGARKRLLVTCHRRENQKQMFSLICEGLRRLVQELPVEILYLLHTNPHLISVARQELSGIDHITIRPAADHGEMVGLMRSSWAILTDSGGLQEDGAALGIPVLVLRDVTERTEAPANIALVRRDPATIVEAVNRLLLDSTHYSAMAIPSRAFGDGSAALQIAAHVEAWLRAHAMKPAGPTLVRSPAKEWNAL